MSNIVYAGGSGVARWRARNGRALSRLDDETEIGLAEIEAKAELQAAKIGAVGYVGNRGMHAVALLSQLEQQLATVVPMSTARLQAMGDMAALAMADVVSDTVRQVSR